MSNFTRRTVVQGGLAAAGVLAAPGIALAQKVPGKTIKAVGDVTNYDPVLTTAFDAWRHATAVYDTLFGMDAQLIARPQMVNKYSLSDDKLTWTFELRDGLKFHDGAAVTTADVIPSIRRFAARDPLGLMMMGRVKDISAPDDKTFTITLKDHRFGLVLDALGTSCFIMRKKEAETDPNQKIDTIIGSGPFRFNMGETRPGTQYVYDRNPDYVPRKEPPSALAGGKVVKIDRLIYVNIADPQTAVAALQAGEVDFYQFPPIDSLAQLSQDKNLRVEVLDAGGSVGFFRFNFLHPPFDNAKCRQAVLHIVRQIDYLKTNFADPRYYKTCASLFGCGTSNENDANTEWFRGAPDLARAKQLLKEGGYDGRPVVILQPTSWAEGRNACDILAETMRRAGFNVQLAPMEWAGVTARRASKAPPNQGGWNIFVSANGASDFDNPLNFVHGANGEKAWFGWPTDARTEELRMEWANAESPEERKKITREMQDNAWNFVPLVSWGQWVTPSVMRTNIKGMTPQPYPWLRPWWNVEKT